MKTPVLGQRVAEAQLTPVAPSQVKEGDWLAVAQRGDGSWEIRKVLLTRDGDHDPQLNCPTTRIWVEARLEEDYVFTKPEARQVFIIAARTSTPGGEA